RHNDLFHQATVDWADSFAGALSSRDLAPGPVVRRYAATEFSHRLDLVRLDLSADILQWPQEASVPAFAFLRGMAAIPYLRRFAHGRVVRRACQLSPPQRLVPSHAGSSLRPGHAQRLFRF